jgi:PAS domain S-box-containing protein
MKKRQGTAPPHKKPGKDTPGQRVLLSQVIDFLPDPTFAIDRAGTVTVWNRAMEEMTGVKAKDMVGKGDCEYAIPFYGERRPILIDLVLHPDPERERAYSSLVRQGDSLYAETIGLPSRRFLWAKASPIRNRRGTITGAIESIRDVTDHKLIEETVGRSEARYRDIFENVSDYLYLHDLDGVFIETNFANKRESGYSEAELNNLSIRDLLPDRHRHRFQNYMKNVVDKGSDEGFLTIVFKDGQERVLEYRNSLITDNQGWPVAVRGSARDITARLRAQKELKKERDFITAIIQTSPAFYVAMDPAGRIVLMNEAMLASLNYGLKAVLGRDFVTTLVHPTTRRSSPRASPS